MMKARKHSSFNWYEEVIREDFEVQEKYCVEVSNFIDKRYKKIREKIIEKLKNEEPESSDAIMKYHFDFNSDLPEIFHDTFLKSAFIISCGLFENYLREISDLILEHHGILKKIIEYKYSNSVLKKCKEKCLELYVNNIFIEFHSEWEIIECCIFIRNKIVHSNSIFRNSDKCKLEKCNLNISVSNYDNSHSRIVVISVDFVLAFNIACSKILLKLVEEMVLKIQNEVTS